jgi:hypothetical protein
MIDLTPFTSVQSNLFVRIQVDQYRTTPTGPFTSEVLRFSDRSQPFTIDNESYVGLGNLVSITSTTSEIRASGNEVLIGISGIPENSINEIINSKIKGSPVTIQRAFFNAATGQILNIPDNPSGRYKGFVNNYALEEEWDQDTRTATNVLVLTCTNIINILSQKVSGRRTNPDDQRKFFPNDRSMDKVPNLKGASFDFGARK